MRTRVSGWRAAVPALVGVALTLGCQTKRPARPLAPAGLVSVDLSLGHYRPEAAPVLRATAVNLVSQRRAIEWFLGEYDRRSHTFQPTVRLTMADLSPASIARLLAVTTPPKSSVPILLLHDLHSVNERTSQVLPAEAAGYFRELFSELSAARLNVTLIDDPNLRWGPPAFPAPRR